MRRVHPILAACAAILWIVALLALMTGRSGRVAATRANWAAWATLGVHLAVVLWSRWPHSRTTPGAVPEWVWVQVEKNRRKGVYLAVWGLSILGLGWWATRSELAVNGWPGQAVWFGVALNLGFQPGMFVAQWLTILGEGKLWAMVSTPKPTGVAASSELRS